MPWPKSALDYHIITMRITVERRSASGRETRFDSLVALAGGLHPIPVRTRPLNPQRQWYYVLRRGRVGRCQAFETRLARCRRSPAKPTVPFAGDYHVLHDDIHELDAGWSSPVARQAHNLKVTGSNPVPATKFTGKEASRISGTPLCFSAAIGRMAACWPRRSGRSSPSTGVSTTRAASSRRC